MTKDIFVPVQDETIQIGQQTNTFSISLSDEVLASIKMSRVGFSLIDTRHDRNALTIFVLQQFEDNQVGFITGRVTNLATSVVPVLEPCIPSTEPPVETTLILPARRLLGGRSPAQLPKSMMIGDLKLTVLKARLSAVGVQAELVGEGVLICGAMENPGRRLGAGGVGVVQSDLDKNVAVRKTARGKVEIEGNASDVYYIVRREVYSMYAVVAA